MFPFEISSSYFEPKMPIPEISFSSSLSSTGLASTCSDSDSTMATTSSAYDSTVSSNVKCQQGLITASSSSSDYQPAMSVFPRKHVHESPTCYFDPSTCQRQNFSIPEKIVYYIAKNVTNAETFQKLVETCKYFFKVNPVIVVSSLSCYGLEWYVNGKCHGQLKYDQPKSFKIWVTRIFFCLFVNASKVIPCIYKNDATVVNLQSEPLKLDHFLFLAGNAKELSMWSQLVQYENGKIVQLEDIVENVPKLKIFDFKQCCDGGGDVNCNTVRKLLKIENFKLISQMNLHYVSEALDVEEMFNLILENQHIKVQLCYCNEISDACKELVREYSDRLKNEEGCNSSIRFYGMYYDTFDEFQPPSFEVGSSENSFVSFDDVFDDDENDDLLFPWKNKEDDEWELPWNKIE